MSCFTLRAMVAGQVGKLSLKVEFSMVDCSEILLLVSLTQILLVAVPLAFTQRHYAVFRSLATRLAGGQCLLAIAASVSLMLGSSEQAVFTLLGALSFQCNGTSMLMFTLVSFIGWITCRYSVRYLDGETIQGRYFKWMSFTLGSVGAMVLSADLSTFCLLWCLTSFGLHNLLLHYAERPAARRAAWTKFIVSRLGDAALLSAVCLYYPLVSSLQFSELAAAATDATMASQPAFQVATCLLAIGILAKSAQMPFHTWLPLTMETPTPVSALMHAGIVNAGGYLLVRSSPLLTSSIAAQSLVIVVGTLTACLASIIMVTQTSIKKKLAYSTIAQMGFMLMQCGLGAYSAAMLHIVAHSLYKAYAFLTSGSVMAQRAAMQAALPNVRPLSWLGTLAVLLGVMATAWAMLWSVGQNPVAKPGGWLLVALLSSAITFWLAQTIATGKLSLIVRASLVALVLIGSYAIGFALMDEMVAGQSTASQTLSTSSWSAAQSLFVLTAFLGLFIFQLAIQSPTMANHLRAWQIHAANGFYLESWLRRRFWLLKS